MRGRLPSIAAIGRVVGLAAVAAAIIATAMHVRHDDARQRAPLSTPSMQSAPLARELAHCQAIGMAANDDAACTGAWVENRRRFFNGGSPSNRAVSAAAINQPPIAKSTE